MAIRTAVVTKGIFRSCFKTLRHVSLPVYGLSGRRLGSLLTCPFLPLPADAIYSGRVENTAVHITPDNKMKVIVYARGGSDSSKPKKPKNLNGVAAPKVKDGGTPAEDIYTSHHHPTVFGVPLDGDFTKLAKPQNQIPFDQFWKFADQFFRPIEEADLAWLQSPGEQMQIYAIPPLGKPYAQQWDDEDRLLSADPSTARTETEFRMDGDILVSGDAVLGPFTERTLQALVSEALLETGSVVSQTSDAETLVQPLPEYVGRTKQDLMDLEERIKVELQYIDLAPPSEVCSEQSRRWKLWFKVC